MKLFLFYSGQRQCILPSMQVRSWATILLSMSFEATSLLGVMASISSMNKIHGAELCKGRKEPVMFRDKDTVKMFYQSLLITTLIQYDQEEYTTDHSKVKQLSELLFRFPRYSRH